MRDWADGLLSFMDTVHPDIGRRIMETEVLDEETESKLRDVIAEHQQSADY